MQITHSGGTYIIHVEQNELIMETLTAFCRDHQIVNGQVSGIGAIREIELGAFDVPTKKYVRQKLSAVHELVNLEGNIILKDGEPFIHAHVVLGNHQLKLSGGHLFEARVAAVGEFIVRKIDTTGERKMNPEIGLATMYLSD